MCASDCPMREYGTGGGGRGARTALHGKPPTAFVGAVKNEVGPGYDPAVGSTHLGSAYLDLLSVRSACSNTERGTILDVKKSQDTVSGTFLAAAKRAPRSCPTRTCRPSLTCNGVMYQ